MLTLEGAVRDIARSLRKLVEQRDNTPIRDALPIGDLARSLRWIAEQVHETDDPARRSKATTEFIHQIERERLQFMRERDEALAEVEAARAEMRLDETDLLRAVTEAVREADQLFEKSGGSSRHYVRECLLPTLAQAGLVIVKGRAVEGARS